MLLARDSVSPAARSFLEDVKKRKVLQSCAAAAFDAKLGKHYSKIQEAKDTTDASKTAAEAKLPAAAAPSRSAPTPAPSAQQGGLTPPATRDRQPLGRQVELPLPRPLRTSSEPEVPSAGCGGAAAEPGTECSSCDIFETCPDKLGCAGYTVLYIDTNPTRCMDQTAGPQSPLCLAVQHCSSPLSLN